MGLAQGVMAYVILRPLMTLIAFIASLVGVLGDGQFRFDRVYIYTAFVNNFSQVRQSITWTALLLDFVGCRDQLATMLVTAL